MSVKVWTKGLPTRPGVYRVRGWNVGNRARFCVVEIRRDTMRGLVHNLHEETSCELSDFRPLHRLSSEFEWCRLCA